MITSSTTHLRLLAAHDTAAAASRFVKAYRAYLRLPTDENRESFTAAQQALHAATLAGELLGPEVDSAREVQETVSCRSEGEET